MKLKQNKNTDDDKKLQNYNINKLRDNPGELESENITEQEDIIKMIRNGEKGREFNNWDKYDHRIFNTKLWKQINKYLKLYKRKNSQIIMITVTTLKMKMKLKKK